MKRDDRLDNLRYNGYQRNLDEIQQGNMHWEMVVGKKGADLSEFITTIFSRGRRSPWGAEVFTQQRLLQALNKADAANKVYAYINRNRWIADCPCGGAEVVNENEPFFYCFSCHNEGNKGRLYKVSFPKKHDIKKIETALKARDKVKNRNWNLDEPISKLDKENEQHKDVK